MHHLSEKFATPKSIFFTCPNTSHSWKQEKPKTTTLNSQKERKKTAAIVRSLSHAHKFRTSCSNRRGKGQLFAHPEEPSLSSIKEAPVFHCTIAAGRGPYISYGRYLQTCLSKRQNIFRQEKRVRLLHKLAVRLRFNGWLWTTSCRIPCTTNGARERINFMFFLEK